MTESEINTHDAKFRYWTAIVTLFCAILAFTAAAIQLFGQRKQLERFEQSFHNLQQLKDALRMPLEGEWDYRVDYTQYFGQRKGDPQVPNRHMTGKAIFLWKNDVNVTGYSVFIGAGVHEAGKDESFVTAVSDNFMHTDTTGFSPTAFSLVGHYVARTSSDPQFAHPADLSKIDYTNGKIEESPGHRIIKMTFTFHSESPSDGTVTFTRK